MGAPNVYDTHYVNSGPGVGLSSSGQTYAKVADHSGSSYSSGHSGSNDYSIGKSAAQSISNAVSTNPAAGFIRDNLVNPATSALSAGLYNDYIGGSGLAFDMDEYYDRLLDIQDANNKWSADQAAKAMAFEDAQAKRQMDYQTASDRYAMAWSAWEANKQRRWTEDMSNTAHKREMKDLLSAGLNPILAANNGASSGSGATGQGFASSGASGSSSMGQTDMSVGNAFASMMSGMMTTARDLAVTRMTMAQSKYNADMQYASAKLAAGASIYNNNNTVSAQKAINALNRDTDIKKASISAEASKAAAGMSAGAIMNAAASNASAARYSADKHAEAVKYGSDKSSSASMYGSDKSSAASMYGSDKSFESTQYSTDRDIRKNPYGAVKTYTQDLANSFSNFDNVYTPDLGTWNNTMGAE